MIQIYGFSADIGGGTIQFVMYMENKSWIDAIKELLNMPVAQYSYTSAVQEKSKEEGLGKRIGYI